MAGTQFYRPARSYPSVLSEQKVVIKAPPTLTPGPKGFMAILQFVLPIVGSLGGMVMIFGYGQNPLFLFAGIFMVVGGIGTSIGMGFARQYTQKAQFKRQEQVYGKYLAQHETRLKALAQQQRMVSKRLYPTYADLAKCVKQQKYLWERRPELADFPFGDVFLIIDNFGLFLQEFDGLEDDIVQLLGSGLTYGVHIVLAANRWFEVRTNVRDNIGTRLEFRLEPIFIDLLSTSPHFLILGDTECGKTTLMRGLLRSFEQRYKPEDAMFAIVDYRKVLVDFVESKHLLKYAYNAETLKACLDTFRTELLKRQKTDGDDSLSKRHSSTRRRMPMPKRLNIIWKLANTPVIPSRMRSRKLAMHSNMTIPTRRKINSMQQEKRRFVILLVRHPLMDPKRARRLNNFTAVFLMAEVKQHYQRREHQRRDYQRQDHLK